ncbi:lysR substrate binding domain-containing protein [Ditylenchus destructor]|nr:lysR substrate binding domain-containing protein [Ditylenchus destructor]
MGVRSPGRAWRRRSAGPGVDAGSQDPARAQAQRGGSVDDVRGAWAANGAGEGVSLMEEGGGEGLLLPEPRSEVPTPSRSSREAPVDQQIAASDEPRFRPRQIGHHRRDLIDLPVPAQRHQVMQRRAKLRLLRIHVRVHRSRRHVVDRDPTRAQTPRHALDQPDQRRLAHRIRRAAAKGMRCAFVLPMLMIRPPSFMCLAAACEATKTERTFTAMHAGAVDQDVQASELLGHAVDGQGERIRIGRVRLDGDRPPAGGLDFLDQRLGGDGRRGVADGDRRAVTRQPARGRGTDAAGTAVDERDLAGCSWVFLSDWVVDGTKFGRPGLIPVVNKRRVQLQPLQERRPVRGSPGRAAVPAQHAQPGADHGRGAPLRAGAAALGEIGDALTDLRQGAGKPAGTLKVALAHTVGREYFVPLMGEFVRRYPDVVPDLHFDNRQVDLIAEGFDVAIGGGIELTDALIARELARLRIVLVAAPSYLQAHPAPTHPSELARHRGLLRRQLSTGPLVAVGAQERGRRGGGGQRAAGDGAGRSGSHRPGGGHRQGIAMLPRPHALPLLERGELVRVLPDWYAETQPLSIYFTSRKLVPAKVRVFVDYIVKEFPASGQAARFQGR